MYLSGKKILPYFKILLIFLYLGYYGSITLFYHLHLINNQIISHSHPFKSDSSNKTPFQQHSHTSADITLIQQFNETNWNNNFQNLQILEPLQETHFEEGITLVHSFYKLSLRGTKLLRAPPFC